MRHFTEKISTKRKPKNISKCVNLFLIEKWRFDDEKDKKKNVKRLITKNQKMKMKKKKFYQVLICNEKLFTLFGKKVFCKYSFSCEDDAKSVRWVSFWKGKVMIL